MMKIKAIIIIPMNMPTLTPVLNIPPRNSHEVKMNKDRTNNGSRIEYFLSMVV
jgi:hypothetical protein